VGILLPVPVISSAFLQDPVTFPRLSCRILRDPVAVIIDLGILQVLMQLSFLLIQLIQFVFLKQKKHLMFVFHFFILKIILFFFN
jgi:hypothetical protein